MKKNKPLIVVTTGGTGGHIFPAESIAGALIKAGYRVAFMTDKRGQSFQGLEGVKVYRLSAERVMGRSLFHKIDATFKLGFGVLQALWLLKKLNPVMVIGVGGYASIPAVTAAHLWQYPVVLHEQNAVLGRANRLLGRYARAIATSFDPTYQMPSHVPAELVGMPARLAIVERYKSPYKTGKDFHLLIFGGSQGASFFAHQLAAALASLPEKYQRRLCLTQQVRPEDKAFVAKQYQGTKFKKLVTESFFTNMPDLLVESQLVIGRSGASTLTELTIIGRPAILIPLPSSADNHQMENARQFCDAGAGWLINEKEFDAEKFKSRLMQLMDEPALLKMAAVRALTLAKIEAGDRVAALVTRLLKGKK